MTNKLSNKTLGKLFEEKYVSETGYSPWVTFKELEEVHPSFACGNGCGWGRSDTRGYLGKKYVVERKHKDGYNFAIRTNGFRKEFEEEMKKDGEQMTLFKLIEETQKDVPFEDRELVLLAPDNESYLTFTVGCILELEDENEKLRRDQERMLDILLDIEEDIE